MTKAVEKILREAARDAGSYCECTIAAILTLAVVGTVKHPSSDELIQADHAIRTYKSVLQLLRGAGGPWN